MTRTFATVYQSWLSEKEAYKLLKDSTRGTYESIFHKHFLNTWSRRPINSLESYEINDLTKGLFLIDRSPRYIFLTISLLSQVFEYAKREKWINENPCDYQLQFLIDNKSKKKPVQVFETVEIERIKAYFVEKAYISNTALFFILAETGMRIGEVLALSIGDVHIPTRKISVNKSIYKGELREYTKTGDEENPETRIVLIPDSLAKILTEYFEKKIVSFQLFPASSPEHFRNYFNFVLTKLNIPHRKIHALRASYITHSLRKGLTPLFVAQQVGDTVSTIYNNYVGLIEQSLTEEELKIFNRGG